MVRDILDHKMVNHEKKPVLSLRNIHVLSFLYSWIRSEYFRDPLLLLSESPFVKQPTCARSEDLDHHGLVFFYGSKDHYFHAEAKYSQANQSW